MKVKLKIGQSFEVFRSKDGNKSLVARTITVYNSGLKGYLVLPHLKTYVYNIEVYPKPIARLTITKIK